MTVTLHQRVKPLTLSVATATLLLWVATGDAVETDWKNEWERTLQAAKKEGQLNIYIFRYEPVVDFFRKQYPDIKVTTVKGRGSQIALRIAAERRAGKYLADIVSSGANSQAAILYKAGALDPFRPTLILPEVLDESKWFGGKHRYADPEGKYIFAYLANPSSGQLSYNMKLVSAKEFQSYSDLVHPRWKGKITSLDPRDTGLGGTLQFLYYHPDIGPQWLKKFFGGMDISYSRDFRQMTDWVARGEMAICMGCKDALRAKEQGLAIDEFDTSGWKEGVGLSTGGGAMSVVNRSPHPNAAKVFINWFLSREGQSVLQKVGEPSLGDWPNSGRMDIPKDDVDARDRLVEGRRYVDVTRPEWQDMTPIFRLMGEVMKKK